MSRLAAVATASLAMALLAAWPLSSLAVPARKPPAKAVVRAPAKPVVKAPVKSAPAHAAPSAAPAAPRAGLAPKRYTIEQFMATTVVDAANFSADGQRILITSNTSGIFNVYSQPVAGGVPVALTRSTTDSLYAVSYFPADDRVLFSRDQGGNELSHLYVRELDGSERDLTPGPQVKASFVGWAADGQAFFVATNERDPHVFDLYRYESRGYGRSLLYRNELGLEVAAVSPDGRWVALNRINTTADADVFLLDTRQGAPRLVTSHAGVASYKAATFDPASRQLLLLTNVDSDFVRLQALSLDSGAVSELDKADWDISNVRFSRDGRYRITSINADASTVIRVVDTATGQALTLPKLPGGEIRGASFSRDGQRLAFSVNGDRSPSNLFTYHLPSRRVQQLTQNLPRDIDPADLVESTVVRFKAFDGLEIPAVFWQPKDAAPGHKVPAVVLVHGGPGGQTTRSYNALAQYLANHGYAVLGVNNRGSSGYGKRFSMADDGKHGREPLWDCVEAKTYLAATGVVDPARIGIMGGSYGGYMALAALAFRPEAFKVGVDLFGISNWLRTLEGIPASLETYRQALYQEIGDPVKDRERLVATSPLFHAQEIRQPLLVIQGANDPRVPKAESDDIVEAVKRRGVPVDYLVFDDEGHGFSKKSNQLAANRRILEFLDRYLKAEP